MALSSLKILSPDIKLLRQETYWKIYLLNYFDAPNLKS